MKEKIDFNIYERKTNINDKKLKTIDYVFYSNNIDLQNAILEDYFEFMDIFDPETICHFTPSI